MLLAALVDSLVIDEPLVRHLLRDQHPDLAGLALREVIGGWEFQMWRLGDALAIRLPRWKTSPVLLENEAAWLPQLAPTLPLPIPTPVRAGQPSSRFPLPWSVVDWVPGTPADVEPITDAISVSLLAEFLTALHVTAPDDAPRNPGRYAVPIREAAARFEAGLSVVSDSHSSDRLRVIWDGAVAASDWPHDPVWVHADLIPANVVVREGALAGVIDFGELCVGDPANDLEAAWILLPDGAAPAFFDFYRVADEATIARARGWAVLRALSLVAIGDAGDQGLAGGKPTWTAGGHSALVRLLAS